MNVKLKILYTEKNYFKNAICDRCTEKTTLHKIEYVFDGWGRRDEDCWVGMTEDSVFICDSCYNELKEGK